MQLRHILRAASFAALSLVPLALPSQSIKDRIKRRAEESIGRKADKAVDCVTGDTKCIEDAKKQGKEVKIVPPKEGEKAKDAGAVAGDTVPAKGADALKPGEGAWANFDYKPGERVLLFEDYTNDEIGDFPRSLEFEKGSAETVEWKGGRWLRIKAPTDFYINLKEPLPARFTLEFDVAAPGGMVQINLDGDWESDLVRFENGGRTVWQPFEKPTTYTDWQESMRDQLYRARVMADGRYVKIYVNENRSVNAPNASGTRTNRILFHVLASEAEPTIIGPIRLAAGGRKLYDALAANGRVVTQGIYFDTGSDRIRPESTPTLKEIVAMLTEHADLKLAIEGHTDNVGNAASNQALSEKRAASVVTYLIGQGIDASRLSSKGLGSTKPADSNDTPEGRQNNRRVELVKM